MVENANQGSDTVFASVDYALTDNVEMLVLQGTAVCRASATAWPTRSSAMPATTCFHGGAGADTMSGGIGNDAYFVDNAGDNVIESVGQATIWSSASVT